MRFPVHVPQNDVVVTYTLAFQTSKMTFDDVLRKHVGEIGRYQCLVVLMMNLCTLPSSFDTMEMIFTQATPLFWPKGKSRCN